MTTLITAAKETRSVYAEQTKNQMKKNRVIYSNSTGKASRNSAIEMTFSKLL